MHDQTKRSTLFNPFEHLQFRATSVLVRGLVILGIFGNHLAILCNHGKGILAHGYNRGYKKERLRAIIYEGIQ